jgi:hypothetical protein
MAKLDVKKDLKHLYAPSTNTVSVVTVPPLRFLMIDGEGDPNTAPAYTQAVEALYALSYTLKFTVKGQSPNQDYTVAPLEGLWWMPDMREFTAEDKSGWLWTAMIMQPDPVTAGMVAAAVEEVRRKKNPAALDKVRFEVYDEGLAAQIMHIGPYAAEAPTIAGLHAYIHENGYALRGKHHEIYVSDPGRTAPEKLKTVIRQPMQPTGA